MNPSLPDSVIRPGQSAGDPADLLSVGQQRRDIAVSGLFGGGLSAVQQSEGDVGILLSSLQDRIGVLVAGSIDHVVAQVAEGNDGLVILILGDGVGDVVGPALVLSSLDHGVVAGSAPTAVVDAGVADHGDLVGLLAITGAVRLGVVLLLAAGDKGQRHSERQQQCKKLFHGFPPCFL